LYGLSPAQYAQHYPLHSLTATHCTMFVSICHLQQSFYYISGRYRRVGKCVWSGPLLKKLEILLSQLHISVTIRVSFPRIQISLQQRLQRLVNKLSTVSREDGLEINTKKTKVLVTSTTATAAQVTWENAILEQVKSFHYMGSIITDTCDCRTEITVRLGMARSAARSLTSLWKDHSLNLQLKSRLMQSLVWSVANPGQSMLLTARD